tara:strand:+ start:306 stop:638 length:333 start_codon:yes stop_codon:yes gene_type:complete
MNFAHSAKGFLLELQRTTCKPWPWYRICFEVNFKLIYLKRSIFEDVKVFIDDFDQLMLNGLPVVLKPLESMPVYGNPVGLHIGHGSHVAPAEQSLPKPVNSPRFMSQNSV